MINNTPNNLRDGRHAGIADNQVKGYALEWCPGDYVSGRGIPSVYPTIVYKSKDTKYLMLLYCNNSLRIVCTHGT